MLQRFLISMICDEAMATSFQPADNEGGFWESFSAEFYRIRLQYMFSGCNARRKLPIN